MRVLLKSRNAENREFRKSRGSRKTQVLITSLKKQNFAKKYTPVCYLRRSLHLNKSFTVHYNQKYFANILIGCLPTQRAHQKLLRSSFNKNKGILLPDHHKME